MSDPSKRAPSKEGGASQVPCPICGKPVTGRFAPFCSARCADLDLGRWLKGGYVIPSAPEEAEASAEKPATEEED